LAKVSDFTPRIYDTEDNSLRCRKGVHLVFYLGALVAS
jgi:hypothetical protein